MSTETLANRRVTVLSDGTEYFFTLARWHNALRRVTRTVGGRSVVTEEWSKHLSHGGRGWFERAEYGVIYYHPGGYGGRCADATVETHDQHGPQRDGHQVAVVCAPGTRLFAIDVDDRERYARSNAADLVTEDRHAVCRRGGGWHAYVYVPEHLLARWPRQGPRGGWDVKSMGFVPLPGSVHCSGEAYEPADGEVLIATAELLDALEADRDDHLAATDGGGGGGGGAAGGSAGEGNEPELFSLAGALVRAGHGKEEAWTRWLEHARTLPLSDPAWPWTADDRDVFERQWAYCVAQNAVNHPPFEVTLPVPTLRGTVDAANEVVVAVSGFASLTVATEALEVPPSAAGDEGVAEPPLEIDADVDFPGPDDPLGVARRLADRWWRAEGEREVTTAHWHEAWWRWVGTHWQETSDRTIRNEAYRWLEDKEWPRPTQRRVDGAVVTVNVPTPWRPDQRSVGNVLDAAKAVVEVRDDVEAGTWLDGSSRPAWLIACRNGLLDPATGALLGHTPAYLNTHSLPFEFEEGAGCERWLTFVDQVFKGDAESRDLLQEWFGYVLSGATSAQKMMFMFGPTRSGKGTTARVLNQLLGVENVAAPTLGSFATQFGRATMIGKPLAVIADARSSGKIDKQAVIEQLLAITGEDRVEVDRKNRAQWVGTLPTRVQMMSNELPWFRDSSAAIAKRLLVLWYRRSFLGKEDAGLEDALRGELPGILNWSLRGLARWRAAGRFTVPAVSRDLHEEIDQQASPISEFVAERCRLGEGLAVLAADLFKAWVGWQGDILPTRGEQVKFGNALRAALPGVTRDRQSVNGNREYIYHGIELTHSVSDWVAARPR